MDQELVGAAQAINPFSLLPDFSKLFEFFGSMNSGGGIPYDGQLFSATIVMFLLVTTVSFSIYVYFLGFLPARRLTKKITSLLTGMTEEKLIESRREIRERAQGIKRVSELWSEFDETLVESPSGDHLYNTFDAHHFFNNNTIAPRLTENRLVAAVPGFLTAIGVIGTFAGLQMGLDAVSFDGTAEEQRTDIQLVIAGAAVAFLTSVWGVTTSVLFNFFEKFLEQRIRKRISKLQERIDFLYPRVSPEQSLVNIAESSRRSDDALAGLAERIGEQLQQAVSGMGEQVTAGIKDAMKPAMDSLVHASSDLADRQADGATEALSGLVSTFVDKIAAGGDDQRRLMEKASSELSSSVTSWQAKMSEFLEKLEEFEERKKSNDLQSNTRLTQDLQEFTDTLRPIIDSQAHVSSNALQTSQRIMQDFESFTEKFSEVIGGFEIYSLRLSQSSDKLEQAGTKIYSAGTSLEKEVTSAITSVARLSDQNNTIFLKIDQVVTKLEALQGELIASAESLGATSQSSSAMFDSINEKHDLFLEKFNRLLAEYQSSMSVQFEELTQGASRFLNEYSENVTSQTNTRLLEWNRQTQSFSDEMISTVQMLQNVISDIEDSRRS